MIINEKSMVKQIKAAYKSGGYIVAGIEESNTEELLIYTGNWLAKIRRKNVPKSILAAIVNHTGTIPETGEAYRISKNEVQSFLCEEALKVACSMDVKKDGAIFSLQKTPITYQQWELWQSSEDQQMMVLNPDYTAIIGAAIGGGYRCDNAAWFCGEVSEVYIMPINTENTPTKEVIQHLSKRQWIAER